MHHAEVHIVLDSRGHVSPRLTTFQLRYWRPIHSELMTHRVFSRNAGSSRARPSQAIIDQVRNDPWGPLHWGQNQAGMQASQEMNEQAIKNSKELWRQSANAAAFHAEELMIQGAHKQIVNRVLEPYTYIDVLVTATQFANWFALRNHGDAQPEIKDLAARMLELYEKSEPTLLLPGEWHLPYINAEDREQAIIWAQKNQWSDTELLLKMSTARCARISYALFDGSKASIEKDLDLYHKLIISTPLHASPAEHQATPDEGIQHGFVTQWLHPHLHGNLGGWIQYRKTLPNEFVAG